MSKFLIKLKTAHQQSGKTVYRVSKDTGIVYNTVKKYVSEWIEAELLSADVVKLAEYYGMDWRSPDVVEIIDDESGDTRPLDAIDDEEDSRLAMHYV